jgi:polyisoprenoid-binding protein YceI
MATVETTTQEFAPAGVWNADPVHSQVGFEIVYAGSSLFRGSFRDFGAQLEGSSLAGSAKVASVDVKDEQLNGHLQTPDFFDAERFPELTFRSQELHKHEDGTVHASGELTIKGVTQPVELSGRISGPATDPFGRERVGLSLETTIDRNEYGVSWNAPNQSGGNYLGDDVKLIAELTFVKEA